MYIEQIKLFSLSFYNWQSITFSLILKELFLNWNDLCVYFIKLAMSCRHISSFSLHISIYIIFFLSDLCTWVLYTAHVQWSLISFSYFFFVLFILDKIFPDSFLISVPQPSTFKIAEIEKRKGKSMAFSKESRLT